MVQIKFGTDGWRGRIAEATGRPSRPLVHYALNRCGRVGCPRREANSSREQQQADQFHPISNKVSVLLEARKSLVRRWSATMGKIE